jgi:protein SCO1
MKSLLTALFPILAIVLSYADDRSLNAPPSLQGIGIDQHLNAAVPLNSEFSDEHGAHVQVRDYFHGKPVLLLPVYYTCPNLCGQTLNGAVAALRPLSLTPGRDFEVVAISFNSTETPADALQKRDLTAHHYSRTAGTAGWHFLTGTEESIGAVMNAIGFRYRYDPTAKMFMHAAGAMVLTPEGKIARYLYGVDYEPKDLKLALIEASRGKIGSRADQILLYCYHYDPTTGKYTMTVVHTLQLAGGLTILLMVIVGVFLWRFDLRHYGHRIPEVRLR